MSFTVEDVRNAICLFHQLYEQLVVGVAPEDVSYLGYLDSDTPFALNGIAYYQTYAELVRLVFRIEGIGTKWSEKGVTQSLHERLVELAVRKKAGDKEIDFDHLAESWLSDLDVTFEEKDCYVPIRGLSVENELAIGKTVFHPLDKAKQVLEKKLIGGFFENLHPIRDCIATVKVAAEDERATEILRSEVDASLNILRYFGSLVWHSQPHRHINVAGQELHRVSHAVVVPPAGTVTEIGRTEYTPLLFTVDNQFMQYAEFYGFSFVRNLVQAQAVPPLHRSFLLAVQWYGHAVQELNDLYAFVKFYVAIETAIKRMQESAKTSIPRRLSVLIEPFMKTKQRSIMADLKDLVDERNAIFHSGAPENKSIEYLAWFARVMSMQCLHHLRIRIEKDGLETKEDLDAWVDHQYDKYLS